MDESTLEKIEQIKFSVNFLNSLVTGLSQSVSNVKIDYVVDHRVEVGKPFLMPLLRVELMEINKL